MMLKEAESSSSSFVRWRWFQEIEQTLVRSAERCHCRLLNAPSAPRSHVEKQPTNHQFLLLRAGIIKEKFIVVQKNVYIYILQYFSHKVNV